MRLLVLGFLMVSSAVALYVLFSSSAAPPPTPGPSSAHTDDGALASFDSKELFFTYPAHWQPAEFDMSSTRTRLIVYLSSEPLSDPCTRDANSTRCEGSPVEQLGADGVLVGWRHWRLSGWVLDETIEHQTLIGGRRATFQQYQASASCTSIGGEEEVQVQIEVPGVAGNWYGVDACVRGPSIAQTGNLIAAMLASVRWKN